MSLRVLAAPGRNAHRVGGGVGTAAAEATRRSLFVLGRRARERLHVDDHNLVVHEIHEDDLAPGRFRVRAVPIEIVVGVAINTIVGRLARLQRVGGHVHVGELVAFGELQIALRVETLRPRRARARLGLVRLVR